jgi:cell division protein FtsN
MENLRKKNETEIQNKIEGHSSRIEQTEDRISEDEMAIKGKTEELLNKSRPVKRKCKNSLTPSQRSNLRSMGIEGEEVQANLEKTMPIQVQEASTTVNRPDQNRTTR